ALLLSEDVGERLSRPRVPALERAVAVAELLPIHGPGRHREREENGHRRPCHLIDQRPEPGERRVGPYQVLGVPLRRVPVLVGPEEIALDLRDGAGGLLALPAEPGAEAA